MRLRRWTKAAGSLRGTPFEQQGLIEQEPGGVSGEGVVFGSCFELFYDFVVGG